VSLTGALEARDQGLIEPILIGPDAKIQAVADALNVNLDGIAIESVAHSHAACERAVALCQTDVVESVMKGSLHTDELMGALLAKDAGLRTERRVSHVFVFDVPTYPRPLLITDAAINIKPSLAAKRDIVQNAIGLAHALQIEVPKVAILSAVETVTPTIPSTVDAAALCTMAQRGQITGGMLDGPLAFDNAVSETAAKIKGIHSDVAGLADILVTPDLESGNMLAKQLEYLGQGEGSGIVLGLRLPIILTSRADNATSRLASSALAVILHAHQRGL
jgi:phosphotransacetylase